MKNSTQPFRRRLSVIGALLLIAATATMAQGRPGIDRPIRVGMLNGVGSSFNHTNLHTASSVVAALLASPATGNLGDSLVIPNAGFSFYSMPVKMNTAGTAPCEGGSGCGPSAEQIDTIVAAFDTLDVLVMNSNTDIGFLISNTTHRQKFETFWATKGFVSIHATTDSKGRWAQLDTVNGTQFNNHPSEQNATLRRDSVHNGDTSWQYLNRGLFSNGLDTAIYEEWLFYVNSGSDIRARAHLKPTTKVIETGMTGITTIAMGDHPHSWYRKFPTGGRTFYTGMGHRANVWTSARTFRRQVYNAILWAAKYDSIVNVTSIDRSHKAQWTANEHSRLTMSAGSLNVTMIVDGPHSVELLSMDGKRVAMRQGIGLGTSHEFKGLRPGVYIIRINTSRGQLSRLTTLAF